MQATDGAGPEGQSEEDGTDEQLSATSSDRGGRGGGQTRPPRSAEREQLFKEGKCFICKQKGHIKPNCPKNPAKKQQGKAEADK
jgi:hypothetical protein